MKKIIFHTICIIALCPGNLLAQDKTGSFSCKVNGAPWTPSAAQRYTGLLIYQIKMDTTLPKSEAIIVSQSSADKQDIMMEIPYTRGSTLPSDSVKFSLTKDGIVYSAMLQHLALKQSLTADGKKVYVSFSIPEIHCAEVLSLDPKAVTITDLKCENLLVRLKWM